MKVTAEIVEFSGFFGTTRNPQVQDNFLALPQADCASVNQQCPANLDC